MSEGRKNERIGKQSEASLDLDTSIEENKLGPDYFGYYTREVMNLLSQTKDFLPFASQSFDLAGKTSGFTKKMDVSKHNYVGREGNSSKAGALFCDPVGSGISNFKMERLKVLLRQSVQLLTQEIDEMVEPVFAMCRIQRYKMKTSSFPSATCEGDCERPQKKLKLSSSLSSIGPAGPITCGHNEAGPGKEIMDLTSPRKAISSGIIKKCYNCLTTETSRWSSDSSLCIDCEIKSKEGTEQRLASNMSVHKEDGEVNRDLQLLLQTDKAKVEETMKKIADELSGTLGCKKQKLEELLDTVASSFRLMTLAEKQQLRNLIQKLPPKNLDRVVDIIGRSQASATHSSDKITVDLEELDNRTLWRLYDYVKAVENARKLSNVDCSP